MLATQSPWLAEVTAAVTEGTLSVAAADAIASGLGVPTADVAADDLADAANRLVDVAGHVTPEKIAAAARAVRDELDSSGVADREEHLRSKRFLKLIPRPDGSVKLVALLDPESAAVVISAEDAVTAPRRGGPRFVDPDQPAAAAQEFEDSRTTEQIALDAFVDMIRIATRADEGTVFPQRQPSVRVHVTLADLERRAAAAAAEAKVKAVGISPDASASVASVGDETAVASDDDLVIGEDVGAIRDDQVVIHEDADPASGSPGYGYIEGSMASLSLESIERLACAAGYVPILFDGGQPLNLGRSQRLFSASQRLVLAARDGGCIADGCDRPPSWCEAHHIRHWYRDHGNTDVNDGVLLCHHHHMLVHNHGWEITRTGSDYWFIPPVSIDPKQKPRPAQKRRQLCPALA